MSGRSSQPRGLGLCALFLFCCATPGYASPVELQPPSVTVEFRAVGHDPRWLLEVDRKGAAHLIMAGGGHIVRLSATGFDMGPRSSGLIYGTSTETRAFVAEIVAADCLDAISGERLTHTVTIRLNAREYRGCGRGFKAGEIAD